MPRYRKGPSTCFDNNLSVRSHACQASDSTVCHDGHVFSLCLQENTSDCGRGHSFRASLHTLLLLQLLLLYPALSPLLPSTLK